MHYSGRWSTDNAKTQKHDHVKRRTLTLRFRVSPLLQKSHRYRPKSPARISSGHAKKKKESPSVQFSTEAQRYTWNHKDEVTIALVPLHDEAYHGLATQTSQIYGNALRATLPKGKSQAQSRWSSEMSSKLHHAIAKMKATALRNEVLEDIQAWGLDCDQTQCTNWPVVLDPTKGQKYVFDKPEVAHPLTGQHLPVYEQAGMEDKFELYSTIWTIGNCSPRAPPKRISLAKTGEWYQNTGRNICRATFGNDDPKWSRRSVVQPLMHGKVDIVGPNRFASKYVGNKKRIIIIDSGSSTNVLSEDVAEQTLSRFIGDIDVDMELETANDVTSTSRGVRLQIAPWDMPTDYVLLDSSPELISMGERTMLAGFTFVWVAGKQPCYISPGGRYIVILEIDELCPVWGPHHETSNEFYGTYELADDFFFERCGISLGTANNGVPGVALHTDLSQCCYERKTYNCKQRVTVNHNTNQQQHHSSASQQPNSQVQATAVDEPVISPTQIIAPPTDPTDGTQTIEEPPEPVEPPEITWRQRAKRKSHCFLHDGSNPHCPGCQAKSRDKRHYKGSFDVHRATHSTSVIVTMDQVTIADSEGQVGIGDVKYAIVISKLRYEALDHDYWTFLPLRSLESPETDVHFQQFYRNVFRDGTQPVVYCDAHKSLIKACDDNAIVCSHPPPGRPQANPIIERKIGIALGGIRSYLVTAGLPNCFWPFAGHCFSLNHCLIHGSYQQAMDHDIVDMFVTGQLVFFKPAPTIDKQSKVEPTLRPGIFLDLSLIHISEPTRPY